MLFIILKTYDQQFTLTTKKSLHTIFKKRSSITQNLSVYVHVDFSSSVDDVCSMPMTSVLHLLPSEVIFYICSFLEAKFLLQSVSLVCKRFYHILSDVEFWRARLRERWQMKYPPVPGEVFASSLAALVMKVWFSVPHFYHQL